jgi:hypothetical protein
MCTHLFLRFKRNNFKTCVFGKLPEFRAGIHADITVAAQVCERHFNMITQPQQQG